MTLTGARVGIRTPAQRSQVDNPKNDFDVWYWVRISWTGAGYETMVHFVRGSSEGRAMTRARGWVKNELDSEIPIQYDIVGKEIS